MCTYSRISMVIHLKLVNLHEGSSLYSLSFLFPQILRLEIDGSGDPYCVGQWTSNPVGHIEVDPVHG